MITKDIEIFVKESNLIEQIDRDPTKQELDEFARFIALPEMNITEIEKFVNIYQPDARLRDEYGLNVRIGRYYPPFGGPEMRSMLKDIIMNSNNSHELHIKYEKLHPFTDGNGRSGRALWAWKVNNTPEWSWVGKNNMSIKGGFLINFYFQTLHYAPE